MARLNIGNTKVAGFVNHVEGKRLVIGTGSFVDKDQQKVFKESVTVFLDDKYDGVIPAKGEYFEVSGDLVISPRKDKPEVMQGTFNIRFANQLTKLETPVKKDAAAPAPAPAGAADADI